MRTNLTPALRLPLLLALMAAMYQAQSAAARPPAASDIPDPETVTIPGTFQDELGCPGSWQPDCDQTFLIYDPEDDVWQGTFDLPANLDEKDTPPRYKVALNKSWSENYGAKATRNGADIPLQLSEPRTVKFYYDHKTHWVTDNINTVIAVAVGNFQSELGCAQDNDPGCLRSWLEDPDGDDTYSFVTTSLPVGDYEVKVAINESQDETYGQNGASGGAPLPFTVKTDGEEIYFGYDAKTHALAVSSEGAPLGNLSAAHAHWVNRDTLVWNVIGSPRYTYRLVYSPSGGLQLEANGISGGQELPLRFEPAGPGQASLAKFPYLAGYSAFKLDTADIPKVPNILKSQIAVTARDQDGKLVDASGVQIPGVLDDIYSYNGRLGVTFENGIPSLQLWAPTAQTVRLHVFEDSKAAASAVYPMDYDPQTGVWRVIVMADWKGRYYLYEVLVFAPSTGKVETNLVTDPYSFSLSTNSLRSQIVDLDDPAFMPEGWRSLAKPPLAYPEDIVIYELHVRDFSISDESVPAEERGTYMAFTHPESNGMKHLRALAEAGLTHIHLLPVFDFASVDEDKATWASVDEANLKTLLPNSDQQQAAVTQISAQDGFNWGYDPFHYTTPEGSYATYPDGSARIVEFRRMVQALNQAGLRVVMDVVYNHTTASGQDLKSVLDRIVPGYYQRLLPTGEMSTSTCCQNTASEHSMMEKLMIDSVLTWAKAYKVDGFRFDLMGHHMKANMEHVRLALDSLTVSEDGVDGKTIYIYGEGWDFGEVAENARGVNATQLNLGGSGIGTFNDRLRDAARGGGPFNSPQEQGFITGLYDDPSNVSPGTPAEQKETLLKTMDWIKLGLAGNLKDFILQRADGYTVAGKDVDYNGKPAAYTQDPQENIVYVSAHDNTTLFDAIQLKAPPGASLADRVRMNNLGISLVMLSQGIPFFHAGDELLRSKSLDGNSYDSGDWFNRLDLSYQSNNWGVGLPPGDNKSSWPIMAPLLGNTALKPSETQIRSALAHFQEMLRIRKSSRLFRLRTAAEVHSRVSFLNSGPEQVPNLIVMHIDDSGGVRINDRYSQVVALFNASKERRSFGDAAFRGIKYQPHSVQAESHDPLVRQSSFDPATGTFSVPGRTTAVFVVPAGPVIPMLPTLVAASLGLLLICVYVGIKQM